MALAISALCSCYSWDLGVPVDGGADTRVVPPVDAPRERAETSVVDAAPDTSLLSDADSAVDADASSVPDADAPSCASLRAAVTSARVAAKVCTVTTPPECTLYEYDECHCEVFVAVATSAATAAYAAAVEALKSSGCPLGCAPCTAPPLYALCVSGATGSGVGTACSP